MLTQELILKSFWRFIAFCILLAASSCAGDGYDQFLDQSQGAPQNTNQNFYNQQPSYGHSAPPSYSPYQQQVPQYQQRTPQYQQAPVAPNPYYYQQPSYAPQTPSYQQGGGSRYYSNPYAIPSSTRYPNYDADQYYVPPSGYNNVEPPSQTRFPSGAGSTF
jgi:hypothetical protein